MMGNLVSFLPVWNWQLLVWQKLLSAPNWGAGGWLSGRPSIPFVDFLSTSWSNPPWGYYNLKNMVISHSRVTISSNSFMLWLQNQQSPCWRGFNLDLGDRQRSPSGVASSAAADHCASSYWYPDMHVQQSSCLFIHAMHAGCTRPMNLTEGCSKLELTTSLFHTVHFFCNFGPIFQSESAVHFAVWAIVGGQTMTQSMMTMSLLRRLLFWWSSSVAIASHLPSSNIDFRRDAAAYSEMLAFSF